MDLPQVSKMQDDARSMARAAFYMGKAANELGPVALPAAREAAARAPEVARRAHHVAGRLRSMLPEKARDRQTLAIAAACIGAAGFTAAAIAHVLHHRKVVAGYRAQKDAEALESQRRADVERQLSEAAAHFSAGEFLGDYEQAEQEGRLDKLQGPGCFAVCVYELEPEEGDFGSYRDVYVGASKNMAASVAKQLKGEGNLYLHADMVYRTPARVFFFPCEGYEVYARKEGLVRTLGAEGSYNRISEIADLD